MSAFEMCAARTRDDGRCRTARQVDRLAELEGAAEVAAVALAPGAGRELPGEVDRAGREVEIEAEIAEQAALDVGEAADRRADEEQLAAEPVLERGPGRLAIVERIEGADAEHQGVGLAAVEHHRAQLEERRDRPLLGARGQRREDRQHAGQKTIEVRSAHAFPLAASRRFLEASG